MEDYENNLVGQIFWKNLQVPLIGLEMLFYLNQI